MYEMLDGLWVWILELRQREEADLDIYVPERREYS